MKKLTAAVFVMGGFLFVCGLSPVFAAGLPVDTDRDGLYDEDEIGKYFTDPLEADTDGDGFSDGEEIRNGYSPRHGDGKTLMQVDSDEDFLVDAWELVLGTGLMDPDSDGDLYLDGTEVAASFDPTDRAPVRLEKEIRVSIADQTLEYFFGGKKFGSFPVSTGKDVTPTPEGEFEILAKFPVKHYGGPDFSYPNTKWNLHFTTGYKWNWRYYIHGAYWHDNFGEQMSHGCVNVRYEDMEPLYWWAEVGTKMIVS